MELASNASTSLRRKHPSLRPGRKLAVGDPSSFVMNSSTASFLPCERTLLEPRDDQLRPRADILRTWLKLFRCIAYAHMPLTTYRASGFAGHHAPRAHKRFCCRRVSGFQRTSAALDTSPRVLIVHKCDFRRREFKFVHGSGSTSTISRHGFDGPS